MARVTCRCGEAIEVKRDDPDRIVCPRCGVKIRVRRASAGASKGDGLIRFHCRCGRRLKVRAADRPEAGRCPDCGAVVPVPRPAPAMAGAAEPPRTTNAEVRSDGFADAGDARTQEMDSDDVARLQRWAARHGVYPDDKGSSDHVPPPRAPEDPYSPPPALKVEAGLRVCPRCGRPLHMSAVSCRACGAATPKG